jgi:ATP/maltotriose-dependent transcriptional regulator MalT
LSCQTEVALALGDVERAKRLAVQALATARRPMPARLDAHLASARVHVHTGDAAAAEQDLAEALALIRSIPVVHLEPEVHLLRAELARGQGDEEGASREVAEARRLYTELGSPRQLERLERDWS